ncbi:MAG: c-type cytochrome biogenesis protein CcmI, partial [Candidatus Sedimenticola endophacoides]
MTTFWIISAAFIVVALAMVAPSLLRGRRAMGIDRNQQNVVIAQERLVELETDLANGVIDREQFEQTKLELEQALLLDLSDEPGEPGQASPLPGRIALGLLAVLVPALT